MSEFTRDRAALPCGAFVEGWAQCRMALSGQELVSDPSRIGAIPEPTNNLLLMDGELHQTVRRLVTPLLRRPHLDGVRQPLTDRCASLVATLLDRSEVDLMADLAEPLVLEGILSAMEVPAPRREKLGDLVRGMIGLLEPDLPVNERRRAVNAALRATMLFERDGVAGNAVGLHGALEEAAAEGLIPTKVARSTPVVVLHGGYENPLNQLGCLIAWAVAHPDRFRNAAASAPVVLFEEIMRVFSPVRRVARWATADGENGALPVTKGELVWVDLQSANLDWRRFATGGDLDLSKRQGHVGFGYGRHACPGTALARLEGQVLIQGLLTIPPDALREFRIEWRDGVVARGPMKIVRR